MKKLIKKIPVLPFSALVFYLTTLVLWNFEIIPSPSEIIELLEDLHQEFGYLALIIATFLEGIAYLGLYIPGSFIIAFSVFFSDGSPQSLLTITLIVTVVLTIDAIINYTLGRFIVGRDFSKKKEIIKESEKFSKGFIISMLHPNLLAFYFFNAGLEKRDARKIAFIPLFLIPYGFIIANILSKFSEAAQSKLESPAFLMGLIIIWIVVAFIYDHKRQIKIYKKNQTISG